MDEQQLIELLRISDEQAFRWLVDSYRARVFNTILNIVQDMAEAEDATQEVFIQVYEKIGQFRQESSLSTWIYRIAVHKALDKVRRKKARLQRMQWLPLKQPKEPLNHIESFHHPGVTLDNKERAAVLFKAVQTLPEKQRIAFTLIKIQGMRYDEVSAVMEQSIKAIESLVSRARVNLQKQLQSYYHNQNDEL